jgi:uncharacterized protein YndB with AHSA1/START domain
MGTITHEKSLSAKPDDLWAIVTNPTTWDEWFTVHKRWVGEPPAELAPGSKLVAAVSLLGYESTVEWEVRAIDAPNHLALEASGPAGTRVGFTFDIRSTTDGSILSITGTYSSPLLVGPLEEMVKKDVVRNIDASLDRLDALATRQP